MNGRLKIFKILFFTSFYSLKQIPQDDNKSFEDSCYYDTTSSEDLINEIKPKQIIRNKFTPEEDQKLRELVDKHGNRSWNLVSKLMGTRNPRQCLER